LDLDVAFSLDDNVALAWGIIFGQIDGGKWNWQAMRWEE
jgi:hypothetical protein